MASGAGKLNDILKISVVMPTYQSALFINNTLQSIVKQTVIPSQVIIVDDGSPLSDELRVTKIGRFLRTTVSVPISMTV